MFKTYNRADLRVGDICTREDMRSSRWRIAATEDTRVKIQNYFEGVILEEESLPWVPWSDKNISSVGWLVLNRSKQKNKPKD